MLAELTQRMSGVEDVLRGVAQGISGLDERMRVLGEQQARLIEVLTPQERPKTGSLRLDELLAQMVVRLDTQNHLLKDVSDVVSRAMTALPLSVVQAINDAVGPAGEPPHAAPGNGRPGGGA